MTRITSRCFATVAIVCALLLVGPAALARPDFGDTSQPQPASNADFSGHGANTHGPYDSTRDGSPSMNGNGNGNATGKPCAGCVGRADNKNPRGQYPNGSDANAGYECDRNHGIGRTNPAHTGCTAPLIVGGTTTGTTTGITSGTPTGTTVGATVGAFSTNVSGLTTAGTASVLGLTLTRTLPATSAPAVLGTNLARTGSGAALILLGLAMMLVGLVVAAASRLRPASRG